MSENEPAQMIEGRYRIVRNIAEGGMATVYEAIDERLGRTVAIKVMHTQLAKGPHREQFVERFRREANRPRPSPTRTSFRCMTPASSMDLIFWSWNMCMASICGMR